MHDNKNIIEAIEQAIKDELQDFAQRLQQELYDKYKGEFEERMTKERTNIVLNMVQLFKIEDKSVGNNEIKIVINLN